ncbi:DUF6907 domain-containing protein [Streptomyces sp. R-74717]|uniref:DUF6907 domain-containing protein n=1 Tax=Streptomyces sp. R-74717 TaxID=2969820 RepID=UPI0039B40507
MPAPATRRHSSTSRPRRACPGRPGGGPAGRRLWLVCGLPAGPSCRAPLLWVLPLGCCGEGGRQADERAAHRHGAVPRPRPGHPACPAWCTGHTEHPVECRVVLAHAGAEGVMTHGGERLRFAELVQYPYDWCARRRVGVHVELFGFARTLASAELYAPAAALVDHAAQLRALARHLSTRTRRGRRAARHAPCSPW